MKITRKQIRRLISNALNDSKNVFEVKDIKTTKNISAIKYTADGRNTNDSKGSIPRIDTEGEGFLAATPNQLTSSVPGVSNDLASYALSSFHEKFAAGRIKNKYKMILVDYTLAGDQTRLWCIQISGNRIVTAIASDVAHGSGDPALGNQIPTRFSNKHNSNTASLGAFVTLNTYNSKAGMLHKYDQIADEKKVNREKYKGISLRIDGLDDNYNDNDKDRGIVIHGAWYRDKGRHGRSYGCLATAPATNKKIIDFLGTGTFGYKFGGPSKSPPIATGFSRSFV